MEKGRVIGGMFVNLEVNIIEYYYIMDFYFGRIWNRVSVR